MAYREFLKANGIEDHSFLKEVDYQEVLASQEIFNDELTLFSSDDKQREVVVVKGKVNYRSRIALVPVFTLNAA